MKKLLLISPVAKRSLMGGDFTYRLPPFGLLKVGALTPPEWQWQILDEKIEALDLNADADLVGVTAMTPNANRAYEVADSFRRRGIKVVMGGMHPSKMPEEALQHCDTVVIGEAEEVWPSVLEDFEKGTMRSLYRHQNGYPSLDRLPVPDWEVYRPKGYLPVHFVETTRGCPFDCEFCAVTDAFGGRYRNRPLDDIERELRGLRPFEGRFIIQRAVFFTDDNIVANRTHTKELLRRIADLKLRWFAQASVNIARDEEILRLCKESGCLGIFIGFESLSPETIASVGKKVNKPGEYLDVVKRIHDHGLGIDASFVFGFDTDDEGVFDRTLEFVIKAKIEIGFFSILTPYPGTRLYHRLDEEGRILSRDWSLYDSSNVVYRPRNFTPERLLEGYRRVMTEFYSASSIARRFWGTTSVWNFFLPMNLGFRHSFKKMLRSQQAL
jgi:radical SAM superfamily enzyme YgiQ (UPF0313 family)